MAPSDDTIVPESIDLGHVLHEARIHRRISLDEASQDLKIRREYLLALEQNRWQDLPGEVYGQGFLRNYGRLLDLDGDRLVDVRRHQLGSTSIPVTNYEIPKRTGIFTGPNQSTTNTRNPKHARNRRQAVSRPSTPPPPIGTRTIVTLLVVMALLFVGGWYLLNSPGHPATAPVPTTRKSPTTSKKTTTSPTHKHQHHKAPHSSAPLSPASTTTQGRITVATYDVTQAPLVASIHFTGPCWMGYSIDGAAQIGHVYQAGQTLPLQATASLKLIFGTHAFSLTLNRHTVSLPNTPVLWQLDFVKTSAP